MEGATLKITVINGCSEDNMLFTEVIGKVSECLNKKNVNYKINNLHEIKLKNCIGCDFCQNVNPGICTIDDGVNNVLKQYLESDVSIIVTTIKFGSCNSITKNFIDRTEPLFLPYQVVKNGRTVMKNRYNNYPDIIFIGISENNDISSIENFKNTVLNCSFAQASNKVNVKIITDTRDLNILEQLSVG